MIDVSLCLLIALCVASGPGDQPPPIPPGARSVAGEDSLGYEQFRQLSPSGQREAREKERDWLAVSHDAQRVAEGRRPLLPWRFPHRPKFEDEFEEYYRQSFDYAATAVGYCPYDAEAWLQYADIALLLGYDDVAVACTAHAEKTLAYVRDEATRDAHRLELERIRGIANFNQRRFGIAKESTDFVLQRAPRDWVVRTVAARCALQLRQYSEARRIVSSVPESSAEYALSQGVLGAAELGLGNHEAARRAFEEAELRGLVSPEFENDRGRLSLAVGEPGQAVGRFRAALDLEPGFVEAACNLSTAHRRNGNLPAAESVLVAQLTRAPDDGRLNLALAETYRDFAADAEGNEQQEFALRALEQYNLALENGASADEVIERRASLIIYLGGVESAEEYILSLAAEQKASAHVLAVLARVKKREGRLDIAEGILRMATLQDDATGLVFAEFGEVLLRRGALVEARDALETACTMDHTLVISRVNLSLACELLGDMTAAWAALDEAIELDPQHPLVLERVETAGRL